MKNPYLIRFFEEKKVEALEEGMNYFINKFQEIVNEHQMVDNPLIIVALKKLAQALEDELPAEIREFTDKMLKAAICEEKSEDKDEQY